MKYIFVAGAPGSKWSSVVKNVYFSPDINRSDYSDERTYYHDASGHRELMHLGAYYDPGMEFGDWFLDLDQRSQQECEREFDRPFWSDSGIKIVKSHVFAHNIDYLKKTWPTAPVIVVLRPNDACLGWWVRCGEFGITYPRYEKYYRDLRNMAQIIDHQNADLRRALINHPSQHVANNRQLCLALGIKVPPAEYQQDYHAADVEVSVI